MPDIPIKNEDDFSKDIVQAVDKIASEVASASSEFTKSFNGLTASIQAMQNAVVGAINQLKINITNNFKTASSPVKTKKEEVGPTRKELEEGRKRETSRKLEAIFGPQEKTDPAILKAEKDYDKRMNEWMEETHKESKRRKKEEEQYPAYEAKLLAEIAKKEEEIAKKYSAMSSSSGKQFEAMAQSAKKPKTKKKETEESSIDFASVFSAKIPDAIQKINEQANAGSQAWSNLFDNIQKEINETDVSFAIDINEQIQKLADEFENELGPAIQSIDPYLLDARSTFQSLKDDLDEMASVASEAPQSIVELTDSLKDLMSQVDEERVMSKMGPKSLKDVFNIVSAGTQEIPEAIPLSPKGPQGLGDVFRIVAAATQEIPMAKRVFTKDEIRNPQPAFGQLNQASNPWQNLFSNISEDIKGKQEAEAQKQRDAEGLSAGMQFGPSRELFDEFTRISQVGKNVSESLLNLKNNVSSMAPMFAKILQGGIGGGMINKGISVIGEGASKMAGAGSVTAAAGGAALAGFGTALVAAGASLNLVANAANIAAGFINTFAQYVSKSNPATMEQVNLVFNDLQGTIGRALNPTIQALIPLLRYYADFVDASIKVLTPAMQMLAVAFAGMVKPLLDLAKVVIDYIAPVFNILAVIIKGVVEVIAPIIEFITALGVAIYDVLNIFLGWIPIVDILSVAFELVATVIKGVASGISFVIASFMTGVGKILQWLPGLGSLGKGIENAGKKLYDFSAGKGANVGIEKGSSFGAAIREVQNTSISGIGDEVRKASLMAGQNTQSQEDILDGISKKLDKNALADAFALGIAKEKGKRIPEPNNGDPDIAPGEFPGAWDMAV